MILCISRLFSLRSSCLSQEFSIAALSVSMSPKLLYQRASLLLDIANGCRILAWKSRFRYRIRAGCSLSSMLLSEELRCNRSWNQWVNLAGDMFCYQMWSENLRVLIWWVRMVHVESINSQVHRVCYTLTASYRETLNAQEKPRKVEYRHGVTK